MRMHPTARLYRLRKQAVRSGDARDLTEVASRGISGAMRCVDTAWSTAPGNVTCASVNAPSPLFGHCAQARRRGEARSSPVLTIVFRPAALDKLDKDMVNVNIPAIPSKAEDQNPTAYYFGMIRQVCVLYFDTW